MDLSAAAMQTLGLPGKRSTNKEKWTDTGALY
jgi:hypothetical protein